MKRMLLGQTTARDPAVRLLAAAGFLVLVCLAVSGCNHSEAGEAASEWRTYGGNSAGDHYSALVQITKQNVGGLKEAWRLETGEGGLQSSPLMIAGVLYAVTPHQDAIALDAATGKLLWKRPLPDAGLQPVRGLSYWREGSEERIYVSSGTYLNALDPKTGEIVRRFGTDGRIDLRKGLGRPADKIVLALSTPGIVYRDVIIVGFRTAESKPAAPGAVRAYDVRTGKLRWIFNLIPRPGETGSETWPADAWKTAGGANNWAGMALDEARGIVYVPTGSAVDDPYGEDRHGNNLFADSLVAIDATTGKRLWHFQAVHHDLWDRDLPSPPVLLTVRQGGKKIDAVAQATKQGVVFLFDRVTGKPLFPIEERPVPQTTVPGEQTSPTQPFPVKPAPYSRQVLTKDMLTKRTPEADAAAQRAFAQMVSNGPFTAFSADKQTIVTPGFDGGAEWGGQAVDRSRGIFYINSNNVASSGGLTKTVSGTGQGEAIYKSRCAACHGVDRKGSPPEFPSLDGILNRMLDGDVAVTVFRGKGRMPAQPLEGEEFAHLLRYLRQSASGNDGEMAAAKLGPAAKLPQYMFTGYRKFLDPDGYPAVAPPWGTLSAIDMNTGEYVWRIPLGEYPELVAKGTKPTGSENYGGPIVTGSGVLFIGATIYDRKFRAFDAASGRLLWQTRLPYAGVATPITYAVNGRQYVLIAASGSRDPKGPKGSAYIAFALPGK